jgi:hypothetical protein
MTKVCSGLMKIVSDPNRLSHNVLHSVDDRCMTVIDAFSEVGEAALHLDLSLGEIDGC